MSAAMPAAASGHDEVCRLRQLSRPRLHGGGGSLERTADAAREQRAIEAGMPCAMTFCG